MARRVIGHRRVLDVHEIEKRTILVAGTSWMQSAQDGHNPAPLACIYPRKSRHHRIDDQHTSRSVAINHFEDSIPIH